MKVYKWGRPSGRKLLWAEQPKLRGNIMRFVVGILSLILLAIFGLTYVSRPILIDGRKVPEIYNLDVKFSKFDDRDFLVIYVDHGKIDYSIESSATSLEGTTLMVDFYARRNFIPRFLWSENQNTFADPWGVNIFGYEISEKVNQIKVRHNDEILWDRTSIDNHH